MGSGTNIQIRIEMNVKFETKVLLDTETIFVKEITISDSDATIVKSALIAAIEKCKEKCVSDIQNAFDNYS